MATGGFAVCNFGVHYEFMGWSGWWDTLCIVYIGAERCTYIHTYLLDVLAYHCEILV